MSFFYRKRSDIRLPKPLNFDNKDDYTSKFIQNMENRYNMNYVW